MAYNLTNITSAETTSELAIAANTITGGILFNMFMIAIFVIMLLALKRSSDFDESLLVSSFICFIISGIFAYGGYLSVMFPLAFLTILALTGLFVWTTK